MTNDENQNSLANRIISRINGFFPVLSRFHEWTLVFAALVCLLVTIDFLQTSSNLLGAMAPGVFWLLLLWRKPPVKGRKMWIFVTCLWGIPLLGIAYFRLLKMLP